MSKLDDISVVLGEYGLRCPPELNGARALLGYIECTEIEAAIRRRLEQLKGLTDCLVDHDVMPVGGGEVGRCVYLGVRRGGPPLRRNKRGFRVYRNYAVTALVQYPDGRTNTRGAANLVAVG